MREKDRDLLPYLRFYRYNLGISPKIWYFHGIMDEIDHRLLRQLQRDCAQSLDSLAEHVGLSRNACWRRVRQLEEQAIIRRRVALLDPAKVDRGLTVFISVRTSQHDEKWMAAFDSAVRDLPDIVGAYRTSGETDYILRARVADMAAYDDLYRRLVHKVPLSDVSATFVMEEIKDTTEIPVG